VTELKMRAEALARAAGGESVANYATILHGFTDRGIAEAEIRPRENVFTFHAWKALGRHVRKGEHGVKVLTWIPIEERRNAAGELEREGGRRPKSATVFHVSQTDPDEGEK
jgi:antirestriction protein ArdC